MLPLPKFELPAISRSKEAHSFCGYSELLESAMSVGASPDQGTPLGQKDRVFTKVSWF